MKLIRKILTLLRLRHPTLKPNYVWVHIRELTERENRGKR
jgi:hypothetical protein